MQLSHWLLPSSKKKDNLTQCLLECFIKPMLNNVLGCSNQYTLEDFTPAVDMSHGRSPPHQHHFHARSCQNFDQKFSLFLVQIDILQKLLTPQKQIIPHLKALISGYLDFEG